MPNDEKEVVKSKDFYDKVLFQYRIFADFESINKKVEEPIRKAIRKHMMFHCQDWPTGSGKSPSNFAKSPSNFATWISRLWIPVSEYLFQSLPVVYCMNCRLSPYAIKFFFLNLSVCMFVCLPGLSFLYISISIFLVYTYGLYD